jgi:isochorismate pyruvate lyase
MSEIAESRVGAEMETNAEMSALRQSIDGIDEALVKLLAERQRHIAMAAEIKTRIGWPARISTRVDEVIGRVQAAALRENLSPELATNLWTTLVEWSIGYEQELMGATSDDGASTAE